MIRSGLGISTSLDAARAGREVAERALAAAGIDRADGALLIATGAYGEELQALVAAARSVVGSAPLAGASVEGVISHRCEIEQNPAAMLLAIAGCEIESVLVRDLAGEEEQAVDQISAGFASPLTEADLLMLMPDATLSRRVLHGLAERLAPARIVGVAAAELPSSPPLVWASGQLASGSLSVLRVRGTRPAEISVAQSCRAASDWLPVTRSQGHWLLGLDGQPALDVYRAAAREPLSGDLVRASRSLLVATRVAGGGGGEPFVVRNVVGFDEARGGLALAEATATGAEVAVVQLDADAARADLERVLQAARAHEGVFGIYLNCRARGASLFGHSGLESAYLERGLAGLPLLGATGAYQIGPGATLLTYCGVLALVS